MFPNTVSHDFTLLKHLAGCHKETQTCNTELVDSSTATASGSVDTSDKASLKVFEFNELLQDPLHPRNITIIKDVFAEEIHDHTTGSHTDEAQSNRYTYCREVIRPYLKDYPADCPVSDDQLIRDALIAAQQDFPDYQPCFEIYRDDDDLPEHQDSNQSCKLGPTNKDCSPDKSKIIVAEKRNSVIIIPGESQKHVNTCDLQKERNKGLSQPNISISNTNMDANKDACPPPKERDPKCPKKKDDCPPPVVVCEQDKGKKPGPPSACKGREQEGASTCKSNPTPCQMETKGENSEKEQGSPQKMDESQSVLSKKCIAKSSPCRSRDNISKTNNPVEAFTNIKLAFEDFFGKVYKTTKDAVGLIKTESTKQLEKLSAKKSCTSCDTLTPQGIQIKKSQTISSCSLIPLDYKEDPALVEKESEKEVSGQVFCESEEKVVEQLLESVGSTLSVLSDSLGVEKADANKLEEFNNRPCPYEAVNTDTEAPTRNLDTVNNVFTNIKTKLISMFNEYDEENSRGKKPTLSGNSSYCDDHSIHSIRRR